MTDVPQEDIPVHEKKILLEEFSNSFETSSINVGKIWAYRVKIEKSRSVIMLEKFELQNLPNFARILNFGSVREFLEKKIFPCRGNSVSGFWCIYTINTVWIRCWKLKATDVQRIPKDPTSRPFIVSLRMWITNWRITGYYRNGRFSSHLDTWLMIDLLITTVVCDNLLWDPKAYRRLQAIPIAKRKGITSDTCDYYKYSTEKCLDCP